MSKSTRVPNFKEEKEDWESYQERLESFFRLNKTEKDMKVDMLISGLSASQYQTLKNLVLPKRPAKKRFEEILVVMKKHHEGKKNPRTERCNFRSVYRSDDEAIQSIAVRLRGEAARHCSFGGNLDEMLVDQFLAGVKSATIVKKVLENTEGLVLSFQSAVDIALEV